MTENKIPEQDNLKPAKHCGSYPAGNYPIFLAYAFRPIFILLPAYIAVTIVLWGLVWTGVLEISFMDDLLTWHIYEMIFGVASAGIIGFILTALPEFFEGVRPVVGKKLFYITLLWLLGRAAFWLIDVTGIYVVILTNLPLLIWVTALIIKPIIRDPLRRHMSLLLIFMLISVTQWWFFMAQGEWIDIDPTAILKVALGVFMILILQVLWRVNMGVINEVMENHNMDERFIAQSPRYNIAIISIALFTVAEFFLTDNPLLGWLGLAAGAAILNILNDFFLEKENIVFKAYVFPLFLTLILMSLGYGLMGLDFLSEELDGVNHFRHFLTTGVFGLSFLMVMVIVGTVHTGRPLTSNPWMNGAVFLIVAATLLRGLIPFAGDDVSLFYRGSSILWAAAFILYLWRFYPYLSKARVDGLSG